MNFFRFPGLFSLAFSFCIYAQGQKPESSNAINRWLDIVDTKTWVTTDIGTNPFKSNDYIATAIWTEVLSDSILVLNLKVFKNPFKSNQIAATPGDIPKNDLIKYAKEWLFLVAFVTNVHVNNGSWCPNFSLLTIKMNGSKIGVLNIKDRHIKELE